MPAWRNKPKSEKGHFHKRRTYEEGKAEIDAAHVEWTVRRNTLAELLRWQFG